MAKSAHRWNSLASLTAGKFSQHGEFRAEQMRFLFHA
jgi:hypothetical protein